MTNVCAIAAAMTLAEQLGDDEDKLTIPPFLKRYTITGQELEDTLDVLTLVGSHLDRAQRAYGHGKAVEELEQVIVMLQNKLSSPVMVTAPELEAPPKKEIDPTAIRLTAVLKERVGVRIVEAIKEGHDTFARLRKALPVLHIEQQDIDMPDRVLKSALGHAMRGELPGVRVVKLSPKRYGVDSR